MRSFSFYISHSSATKEIARHLYYNSISNGLFPWYDESLLSIGDVLEREIQKGIQSSLGFVLLHSKQAMESSWVRKEMKIAKSKRMNDNNFNIFVVKLDEEPVIETFWKDFLYLSWDPKDVSGSIIKLIEAVTGQKSILKITASSVLNQIPLVINETSTIAEHSRNYILYYLAHIKSLVSAVASVGYEEELRDTLKKLLNLYLLNSIPCIHGGMMQIAPGIWECIYANRMRIPPRIRINGLPAEYGWDVITNNEVFCRLQIVSFKTKIPVPHPVPMILEFDAEL